MFGELLGRCEGLPTRRTHVVFFTCMGAHVHVQMTAVYEPFVAQVTDVGSFSRVNADMVDQARFIAEDLAAREALVLFCRLLLLSGRVGRYVDQRNVLDLGVKMFTLYSLHFAYYQATKKVCSVYLYYLLL